VLGLNDSETVATAHPPQMTGLGRRAPTTTGYIIESETPDVSASSSWEANSGLLCSR
jgi:hypothetical protein